MQPAGMVMILLAYTTWVRCWARGSLGLPGLPFTRALARSMPARPSRSESSLNSRLESFHMHSKGVDRLLMLDGMCRTKMMFVRSLP